MLISWFFRFSKTEITNLQFCLKSFEENIDIYECRYAKHSIPFGTRAHPLQIFKILFLFSSLSQANLKSNSRFITFLPCFCSMSWFCFWYCFELLHYSIQFCTRFRFRFCFSSWIPLESVKFSCNSKIGLS